MHAFSPIGRSLLLAGIAIIALPAAASECEAPLGSSWTPQLPNKAWIRLQDQRVIPCHDLVLAEEGNATQALQCDRFRLDLAAPSTGVKEVVLNRFLNRRFVFEKPRASVTRSCDAGRVTLTRVLKLRGHGLRLELVQTWRWRLSEHQPSNTTL
jgi:hypothetical protein